MIEDYRFGRMTIGGVHYDADLKIVDGVVVAHWWRREGHRVHVEDVSDVLAACPEFFVVGKGKPGMMTVSPQLKEALQDRGISLVEQPTIEAVRTFSRLFREGKKVAGAFHLTC